VPPSEDAALAWILRVAGAYANVVVFVNDGIYAAPKVPLTV